MPPKKRNTNQGKKKRHIILILLLIMAGVFLFFEEFGKEDISKKIRDFFRPEKKTDTLLPEVPPRSPTLPKVSIIIDDLGPNKKKAEDVLRINSPITLSILPQEVYSKWIAREGHRLGRDIIAHIPMEATMNNKLGKGGLYTRMTDREIAHTLDEDLDSIPFIAGASNHMGSAFTQDERAMRVVISRLKKRRLFYLDSLTHPDTVGYRLAQEQNLKTIRRDIFLDNNSDPEKIEEQWRKLVEIAKKRGYAIGLAHPKKNTIEFLHQVLQHNNEVMVVSLSELIGNSGSFSE